MTIRLNIRAARERQGLSQEALAEKAGVGLRTVTAAETGTAKRVDFEVLEKLADALEVPFCSLLVKAEPPPRRGRGRPPKQVL